MYADKRFLPTMALDATAHDPTSGQFTSGSTHHDVLGKHGYQRTSPPNSSLVEYTRTSGHKYVVTVGKNPLGKSHWKHLRNGKVQAKGSTPHQLHSHLYTQHSSKPPG